VFFRFSNIVKKVTTIVLHRKIITIDILSIDLALIFSVCLNY